MENISIILIKPQMGENIGAAARVMKNFGLSDLRVVSPRDGWPNTKAIEMAVHAWDIIQNAKVYNSTEEAVADLNLVYATAAKSRDMEKDIITPEQAAQNIPAGKVGIMFGRESSGLDNEDMSHATAHISIPVSSAYDSLNLAQAICVVCYELFKHRHCEKRSDEAIQKLNIKTGSPRPKGLAMTAENLTERKDINELVNFLDRELTEKNFFSVPEKKPGMMVNIRNIFTKNRYTEQEIRTLRGIFSILKR